MASVWVPFTSESKEAIADYDEIRKEMKLALMECGRKLGIYLRKRARMRRESQRRDIFERYIGEVAQAINSINGADAKRLHESLLAQAKKRTAIADMQLDDEGKRIKEDATDSDGVLIVEQVASSSDAPPSQLSKAEAAAIEVASLAKATAENSQARLIKESDSRKPKRTSDSTGKPSKESKVSTGKPAAAALPPGPKEPVPKGKLRMKLVKGKLIRMDEGQSLF